MLKNRIHALLDRYHVVPPPVSDLFGKRGRDYLSKVELFRPPVKGVRMFAHRCVRAAILVAATALAGFAAADDGSNPQTECTLSKQALRWLNSPGLAARIQLRWGLTLTQGSLVIMAYDHLLGTWSAFRPVADASNPSTFQPVPLSLEPTDDPRVPLIRLGHKDKLLLVVTDVNPLLYSITDEKITAADIPELASIQSLAAAFGGVYGTYVHDLSGKQLTPGPGDRPAAIRNSYNTLRRVQTTLPPVPPEVDRLADVVDAVDKAVTRILNASADAADFLQQTEAGDTAGDMPKTEVWPTLLHEAQESLRQLRVALPSVAQLPEACVALIDIAKAALSIRDQKLPAAEEAKKLSALAQELAVNRNCPAEGRRRVGVMLAAADFAGLSAEVNLAASAKALVDIATSLQSKATTVVTAAAWVGDLARRMTGHVLTTCDAVIGVIESSDVLLTARWDKIYTKTFSVKRTSAGLAETIVSARPPSIDASFQVASAVGNALGIGAGAIYTPLVSPKFGAVQDPTNASQKVIAQTGEESRAGDVVLILAYRLCCRDSWFRPGLQIGAAAASHATLLFGGSFDVTRFVRLGVGVTWQEVDRLSAEQHALAFRPDGSVAPGSVTVVSSSDDIRTRKGVDHAWYLSLTLSLDSVKAFSTK